jgi:hypothetical protein
MKLAEGGTSTAAEAYLLTYMPNGIVEKLPLGSR